MFLWSTDDHANKNGTQVHPPSALTVNDSSKAQKLLLFNTNYGSLAARLVLQQYTITGNNEQRT